MTTIEIGQIGSKAQAEKLTAKITGKTYMNFIVHYNVCAYNPTVYISTEEEDITEDELKNMVLFYLSCEL